LCRERSLSTDGRCTFDANPQTSYRFTPKADKHTLVIVTLSGGGARAAALAFGTLQALQQLDPADADPTHPSDTLLDQVDIISSVSGGSVTAGWYALKGKAGLAVSGDNGKLWGFLNDSWTGQLVWRAFNPWTLARYTFTDYTRSDVLSDFFRDHLFGNATYLDVLERYKRDAHQPYVILNATDLGPEAIFPFTQGHFDLLCADLNQYRLTDAVAASGNFPLAFSPLGLQNFSGCDTQNDPSWADNGPPRWVNYYDKFEGPRAASPRSIQLNELRSARLAKDFLNSSNTQNSDQYIHLLDGGVTDNLGVRSTLALEDDPARVPSLYLRLSGAKRPEGYQHVERVLYIVVNARTRDPQDLDQAKSPPGEIKTALRMVDTQLDASTVSDQDYLIAELEATSHAARTDEGITKESANTPCPTPTAFLSCKPEAQANYPAPAGALDFSVVSVDFEMIPDKICRDTAWLLATNWGLAKSQVQGLVEVAKVILSNSEDLESFYWKTGKRTPQLIAHKLSFDSACALLGAAK
jgi:predicted acylesterase/phospholipase RssA